MKPRLRFKSRLLVIGSAAVLAWVHSPALAQSKLEPFRDGDRWCAIGDENTQLGRYFEWMELFYLTRYPGERVEFINRGINGDTATAALKRLDWDVLAQNPTVALLFFGLNDVDRSLYKNAANGPEVVKQRMARMEEFEASVRTMIGRLKERDVRVILISPFPYDNQAELQEPALPGIDDALASISGILRKLAGETDVAFVDVYGSVKRLVSERRTLDPAFSLAGRDRAHPTNVGQFLIAYYILKASGVVPAVSGLSINLNTGMVTEAVNGSAESIFKSTDRLTFTWTEKSLPFPVVEAIRPALSLVPFQETLNQQTVRILGLEPGVYELEIDGEKIGLFPTRELEEGINLAENEATPQYSQAMLVERLVNVRTRVVADNLRSLAWAEHGLGPDLAHPIEWADIRPLLEKRMDELAAGSTGGVDKTTVTLYPKRKATEAESWAEASRMAQQARKAAIPRSHLYSLRPVR